MCADTKVSPKKLLCAEDSGTLLFLVERVAADKFADYARRRYLVVNVRLMYEVEYLDHGANLVVVLLLGLDRVKQRKYRFFYDRKLIER